MLCGVGENSLAFLFCIITVIYQQLYHMSQLLSFLASSMGPKDSQRRLSFDARVVPRDALGTLLIVADRIFSNILLKGYSIKQCSVIYQLKEAWTNKPTSPACPSFPETFVSLLALKVLQVV